MIIHNKLSDITKRMLAAAVIACAGIFASCTLEMSNNGKLDGMWHITQIDTIATGGSLDMSEVRRFWNIDTHLLEMRDYEGVITPLVMHFSHSDDKLIAYDVYIFDRANGDPVVDDTTICYPYGMTQIPDTFNVEQLKSYRMTLSNKKYRIRFEKY